MSNHRLRIGILGTRGIPNRYGGFEQCAEKLAEGLVERGHDVWVYNSSRHEYKAKDWRGVHIIHCLDPEGKLGTAGQFIYDLNCFNDARRRKFDVLLQLGYSSSSVWWWRWPKCPNVVNMDGLEWKRSKYSPRVRKFLWRAERWAAEHGDVLVADSVGIQAHLQDAFGKPSVFIPYGAELFSTPDVFRLEHHDLKPYAYHLLIARMESENNIDAILRGFLASNSPGPFLIVGNTGNAHGRELLARYGAEPRVRFLGAIYDTAVINNLRYFSHLYYHGHSVGGTNPSLLEAMACSALIVAHDNVFNRAILGEDAFYFTDAERLTRLIEGVRDKKEYPEMLSANRHKVVEKYNWPKIVDEYEAVLQSAVETGAGKR